MRSQVHPLLTEEEISACLTRITAIQAIQASPRLLSLVRYLFEETLAGRGAEVTQYTIAAECLGILNVYDADQNSLVRVHASRLRRVLKTHYEGQGSNDRLQVRLPPGSYALKFERSKDPLSLNFDVNDLPVVGLLEFKGVRLENHWRYLPMAMPEELSSLMQRQGNLKTLGPFSRRLLEAEGLDPVQLGSRYPVDFILDGSVEQLDNALVLRTRLLEGRTGMQIWSGRDDLDLERPDVAGFEDILMRRLSASIGEEGGVISRHLSSLARVKQDDMLTVYEAVLLGRMYLSDYDHQALPRVLETLRRAVRQAPYEVAPHATLAVLLSMLGMEPQWPGDPPVDEIRELAKQAMQLCPVDPWSVLAQAFAAAVHQDRKELERIGRTLDAGELDASAMLLGGVGVLMCCQKANPVLGVKLIAQAIRANPHYTRTLHVGLALVLLEARNFNAARQELDAFQYRWGLSDPLIRGAMAALDGETDTAHREWQRVLESFPSFVTDGERSLGYLWHADYILLIRHAYRNVGISVNGL